MRRLLVVLPMVACQVGSAESVSPFDVGDRAQLFVDKVLVRSTEDLAFTLHPAKKHPNTPVLRADKLWESWGGHRVCLYGSVLYDEEDKVFKMWYWSEGVLYAISKDGINWDKPLVGTVRWKGSYENNIVENTSHCPSVIKDNEDPDPSRRYKRRLLAEKR